MCGCLPRSMLPRMTFFFQLVLGLHIGAGILALLVFWVPLVTKKGGTTHRRVGWIYVVAASTVAVTGMVSCTHLIGDGRPGRVRAGVFLAYVGVLAGASAQLGMRALRMKARTHASRAAVDLLPPVLLIAGGVALAAFGILHDRVLYVLFAALGVWQGLTHLRFWLTPPSHGRQWFLAHMSAMGTSCITTVTAFVVVNAQRLGTRTFNLTLWAAPIALLGIGLGLWRRSYAKRFAQESP
jgi:uncharacterized membrane protein